MGCTSFVVPPLGGFHRINRLKARLRTFIHANLSRQGPLWPIHANARKVLAFFSPDAESTGQTQQAQRDGCGFRD